MSQPFSTAVLQEMASSVCEKTFGSSENYEHSSVASWNTQIIGDILQKLIAPSKSSEQKAPSYKYIVNSTIIQHVGSAAEASTAGRRGMHSAVGAYWNEEKDGTYSYKWESGEKKGMDVVITITWIGI